MEYKKYLINNYLNSIKELEDSKPDNDSYLAYLFFIQDSEKALDRAIELEHELLNNDNSEVKYEY